MSNIKVRALVDARDRAIQKTRVAFGLRLKAFERGADEAPADVVALFTEWHEKLKDIEKEITDQIREIIELEMPIVPLMTPVKGIGDILAAKVACHVNIGTPPTISALWRYAGYAVFDGKRERPTKGEKLHYNARLKTACSLVGMSFLKSGSPYAEVYYKAKEKYEKRSIETNARADEAIAAVKANDDLSKTGKEKQIALLKSEKWNIGRIHYASMRIMIKLWLSHLWLTWRRFEGLPTSDPYCVVHMEPSHHFDGPEKYGWPYVAGVEKAA